MQKLLPSFQSIYTVINQIRFYSSDLEKTIKFLENKVENDTYKKITPLKFKNLSGLIQSIFLIIKKDLLFQILI